MREKSTSSQSHVIAEFPWRQQQCSTSRCSPAQLRAGIRHLATAAFGCILPARQVLSLLTEVSEMPLLSGVLHLQGVGWGWGYFNIIRTEWEVNIFHSGCDSHLELMYKQFEGDQKAACADWSSFFFFSCPVSNCLK